MIISEPNSTDELSVAYVISKQMQQEQKKVLIDPMDLQIGKSERDRQTKWKRIGDATNVMFV